MNPAPAPNTNPTPPPTPQPNPFQLLADFLQRFDLDVQGRALESLPPKIRRQLLQFAQGKLDDPGRAKLAAFLKDNPRWIERLAAEVKSRRPPPNPRDRDRP